MVLKKNPIKVSSVSFSENTTFYYLRTLEELYALCSKNQPMFETESDYFVVKDFSVFRYIKPKTLPKILKVQSLELNPDYYGVKVGLSQNELFAFAKREQLFIFETEDSYIIPSAIVMFAKKEKPGKKHE